MYLNRVHQSLFNFPFCSEIVSCPYWVNYKENSNFMSLQDLSYKAGILDQTYLLFRFLKIFSEPVMSPQANQSTSLSFKFSLLERGSWAGVYRSTRRPSCDLSMKIVIAIVPGSIGVFLQHESLITTPLPIAAVYNEST